MESSKAFDPYHKWLGIPRELQPPNFYQLLGVQEFESDLEVLAHAADRRTSHIHGFERGPHAVWAKKILGELSAAQMTLLQPAKKAQYDQVLVAQRAALAAAKPPAMPPLPANFAPLPPGNMAPNLSSEPAPANVVADDGGYALEAVHEQPFIAELEPRRAPATKAKSPPKISGRMQYLIFVCGLAVASVVVYVVLLIFKTPDAEVASSGAHSSSPSDTLSPHKETPPVTPPKKLPGDTKSPIEPPVKPHPKIVLEPVDLLKLINPKTDSTMGIWTTAAGALISPPPVAGLPTAAPRVRLQIPFTPPDEYDLLIGGVRLEGKGSLAIGLISHGKQFVMELDHNFGTDSSIAPAGTSKTQASEHHVGPIFVNDQPFTLICKIRNDRIDVQFDGQPLLTWMGDIGPLRVPQAWRVPDEHRLALGTFQAKYRFTTIQLTPYAPGAAPPVTLASKDPTNPAQSNPTLPNETSKDEPVAKPPAPDAEALKKAQLQLRELFKDDLANAKKPEERYALAENIYKQGIATADDPVARYAALVMAKDMAAQVGNWVAVLQTIDQLDRWYKFDAAEMKASSLEVAIAPPTSKDASNAVELLTRLVDAAVESENFALAIRFGVLSLVAARKAGDSEMTKRIVNRNKEVKALEERFATLTADLAKLKDDPADVAANERVGRWYCFVKADWDKGLPYLLHTEDAALADAAKQEQQSPMNSDAQLALGDAWWALAEKATDASIKSQLQIHAASWYRQAQPTLSGLNKAKVEKRLEEADKAGEVHLPSIKLTNLTPVSGTAWHNALGINQIVNAPDARTPIGLGGERACTDYIFAHAPSKVVFDLPEGSKELRTTGYCMNSRSVKFQIQVDGQRIYESEAAGIVTIRVDLPRGAKRLELIVDEMGDSKGDDSFWCYPRIYR